MKAALRLSAAVLVLAFVGGCTTASLEDAAPKAATAKTVAPAGKKANRKTATAAGRSKAPPASGSAKPQSASATSLTDHGTATQNAEFVNQGVMTGQGYPKFVPPKAATTPMTDAEKQAFEQEMNARMQANQSPTETPGEYAARLKLMRALAAQHAKETLKAIEK